MERGLLFLILASILVLSFSILLVLRERKQEIAVNRITVTAERQTVAQTSHLFHFHTRVEEANVKWGNALGGVSVQRVSNHNLANIRLHVGTRTQMLAILRGLGMSYCGFAWYEWTFAGWLSFPLVGTRQIGRLTRAVAVHVAGTGASETLARARNFVAHELGHTLGFDGHSSNSTFVMHNRIVGNTVIRPNEATHLRQIYDRFRPRHVWTSNTFVNYSAHVENLGWMAQVNNSAIGGTVGQSLRMEAIRINLSNMQTSGGIRYRVFVQDRGWQPWVQNNAIAGTTGERRRLEAILIELTGNMALRYHVEYRVHVAQLGWLPWARNGAVAGITGQQRRVEAIEIRLIRR